MPKARTILGISLGTRTIGLAIIRNRQLNDCRVKTFPDKWSEKKQRKIVDFLSSELHRSHVGVLAIKLPHPIRGSRWLSGLLTEIQSIATSLHIEVHIYYIENIKLLCNEIGNKKELGDYIVHLYPEVWNEHEKHQNDKHGYYTKLFEAIASAHLSIQK